jgi:hypothetical protein
MACELSVMQYMRKAALSILFFCFWSACKKPPSARYKVSPQLASLVSLNSGREKFILNGELAELCKGWPASLPAVGQKLRQLKIPETYAGKSEQFVATLAGCNAWYELTDKKPEKAFVKVNAVLPENTAVHCISVGFMQPWMMLANLNCERLTFIDISAHTLNLQAALVETMIESGRNFEAEEFLNKRIFPYATSRKILKPVGDQKLHSGDICADPQGASCLRSLAAAAKKIRSLKSVDFVLGAIQDIGELEIKPGSQAVFYLSNSIDEKFTTQAEFAALNKRYAQATAGKGLLLYHMASDSAFAVYRSISAEKTATVCSDRFMVTPEPYKDPCYPRLVQGIPFEIFTWADRMTNGKPGLKETVCSKQEVSLNAEAKSEK